MPSIRMPDEMLASATVALTFSRVLDDGSRRHYKRGEQLTRDEVLGFHNRRELFEGNFLLPHYGAAVGRERFIIKEKDGFSVIEGRKLNNKPLSREDAQQLLDGAAQ